MRLSQFEKCGCGKCNPKTFGGVVKLSYYHADLERYWLFRDNKFVFSFSKEDHSNTYDLDSSLLKEFVGRPNEEWVLVIPFTHSGRRPNPRAFRLTKRNSKFYYWAQYSIKESWALYKKLWKSNKLSFKFEKFKLVGNH